MVLCFLMLEAPRRQQLESVAPNRLKRPVDVDIGGLTCHFEHGIDLDLLWFINKEEASCFVVGVRARETLAFRGIMLLAAKKKGRGGARASSGGGTFALCTLRAALVVLLSQVLDQFDRPIDRL